MVTQGPDRPGHCLVPPAQRKALHCRQPNSRLRDSDFHEWRQIRALGRGGNPNVIRCDNSAHWDVIMVRVNLAPRCAARRNLQSGNPRRPRIRPTLRKRMQLGRPGQRKGPTGLSALPKSFAVRPMNPHQACASPHHAERRRKSDHTQIASGLDQSVPRNGLGPLSFTCTVRRHSDDCPLGDQVGDPDLAPRSAKSSKVQYGRSIGSPCSTERDWVDAAGPCLPSETVFASEAVAADSRSPGRPCACDSSANDAPNQPLEAVVPWRPGGARWPECKWLAARAHAFLCQADNEVRRFSCPSRMPDAHFHPHR